MMITIDHRLKLVSPGSLEISQYCSPGDMVTVALGQEPSTFVLDLLLCWSASMPGSGSSVWC